VPQSIPTGLLTIRPPAEPLDVTSLTTLVLNLYPGVRLKVAVQLIVLFMVTLPSVQSALPDQPAKLDPETGVAVKVTAVALLKAAEQVVPQLMPAGLLVTVPAPVPALRTVRVKLEVFETVTVTLCTAVELSL
jgi:hypothetical protein